MALHQALDNDNQAFRGTWGTDKPHIQVKHFCFWKSNNCSAK